MRQTCIGLYFDLFIDVMAPPPKTPGAIAPLAPPLHRLCLWQSIDEISSRAHVREIREMAQMAKTLFP